MEKTPLNVFKCIDLKIILEIQCVVVNLELFARLGNMTNEIKMSHNSGNKCFDALVKQATKINNKI